MTRLDAVRGASEERNKLYLKNYSVEHRSLRQRNAPNASFLKGMNGFDRNLLLKHLADQGLAPCKTARNRRSANFITKAKGVIARAFAPLGLSPVAV